MLLHKHYEWQLISALPLEMLPELLTGAMRKEMEKQTFPLWLANFAISKVKGVDCISYEDFIKGIRDSVDFAGKKEQPKKQKTAEEIVREFMPVIAADKAKIKAL